MKNTLGIGFVCNYPNFGGLEMQTIKRAADAATRGFRSFAIVSEGTPSDEYAAKLGVDRLYVNQRQRYFAPLTSSRLKSMISKHSIDAFVCGKTESLSVSGLALRMAGRSRGNFLYQQMQSGIMKRDWFHNAVYRQLSGAIVLTGIMKKMLIETTICTEEKIAVIPYGIDTNRFNPRNFNKAELKSRMGVPPESFLVGTMGRIDPSKGIDTAMRAFAEARIPASKFAIAGNADDKSYLVQLKELAVDLNIADDTLFIPFTNKQEEFMNALDVFVLASRSETFGLVYAEAQASGLPVIGTNSGGVPEIIRHGETGFLFEPNASGRLAELLVQCSCSSEEMARIGSNALRHANECYDYGKQTGAFFDFLESRMGKA